MSSPGPAVGADDRTMPRAWSMGYAAGAGVGRGDGLEIWRELLAGELASVFGDVEMVLGAWSAGRPQNPAALADLEAAEASRERGSPEWLTAHFAAQVLRLPEKHPCSARRLAQVAYNWGQLYSRPVAVKEVSADWPAIFRSEPPGVEVYARARED